MTGQKWQFEGQVKCRNSLLGNALRRLTAGLSAGIRPDRGENYQKKDASGPVGTVSAIVWA